MPRDFQTALALSTIEQMSVAEELQISHFMEENRENAYSTIGSIFCCYDERILNWHIS